MKGFSNLRLVQIVLPRIYDHMFTMWVPASNRCENRVNSAFFSSLFVAAEQNYFQ